MEITFDLAEKTFLLPLSKLPVKPLSNESGEMLLNLIVGGEELGKQMWEMMKRESHISAGSENRANAIGLKCDVRVKVFIQFVLFDSNFAGTLSYFYYLKYFQKSRNVEYITFETFLKQVVPDGFPSCRDIMDLWDKTKVNGKPVLDIGAAVESII